MATVLVVGEALMEVVHQPNGQVFRRPGGSPANTALALGRLGVTVLLASRIGDDSDGRTLIRHLESSHVKLVDGAMSGEPTSTVTVTFDSAGIPHYACDPLWKLPSEIPSEQVSHIHCGSVAMFIEPGASRAVSLLESRRPGLSASYDPNVRPPLMGRPENCRLRFEKIARLVDVVKGSDEDFAWLYGGRDIAEIAADLLTTGPSLIVVTEGGHGATGFCLRGTVHVPAHSAVLVDTIGAGDAFMAGLIEALYRNSLLGSAGGGRLHDLDVNTLRSVLAAAAHVAALTCERSGCDPPSRSDARYLRGPDGPLP